MQSTLIDGAALLLYPTVPLHSRLTVLCDPESDTVLKKGTVVGQ